MRPGGRRSAYSVLRAPPGHKRPGYALMDIISLCACTVATCQALLYKGCRLQLAAAKR